MPASSLQRTSAHTHQQPQKCSIGSPGFLEKTTTTTTNEGAAGKNYKMMFVSHNCLLQKMCLGMIQPANQTPFPPLKNYFCYFMKRFKSICHFLTFLPPSSLPQVTVVRAKASGHFSTQKNQYVLCLSAAAATNRFAAINLFVQCINTRQLHGTSHTTSRWCTSPPLKGQYQGHCTLMSSKQQLHIFVPFDLEDFVRSSSSTDQSFSFLGMYWFRFSYILQFVILASYCPTFPGLFKNKPFFFF